MSAKSKALSSSARQRKPPAKEVTEDEGKEENIIVAVRVRPFLPYEKDRQCKLVVEMKDQTCFILDPEHEDKKKKFVFDQCIWSHNPDDEHYRTQEDVYAEYGVKVLDSALSGYNVSCFAYGQTGAGKSFSMVGSKDQPGIIPRATKELFRIMEDEEKNSQDSEIKYALEVSMVEIYNEEIRDLLNPANNKPGGLRVREHPKTGPYVEDLSQLLVTSQEEVMQLMDEGTQARTIASTNMNEESSRAHTVFQMFLTVQRRKKKSNKIERKLSKVHLVDLAGSERIEKSGAEGARMKEAVNINKSLSTFGNCISALANRARGKNSHVPYRDSSLTWLLKDSLGGNARTIIIAAISPSDYNYDETLNTLRYAARAKLVKKKVAKVVDPNEKLINELNGEINELKAKLQEMMGVSGVADLSIPGSSQDEIDRLNQRLEETKRMRDELNMTFEAKLERTEEIKRQRAEALQKMGIAVDKDLGLRMKENKLPYLINLNEDPLLSENFVVPIAEGATLVGRPDAAIEQNLKLQGLNVLSEHAKIEFKKKGVYLIPLNDSKTFVNGTRIKERTEVHQGDRIVFGDNHLFRVQNPLESKEAHRRSAHNEEYARAVQELDAVRRVLESQEKDQEREEHIRRMEAELEKQRQVNRENMEAKEAETLRMLKNVAEREGIADYGTDETLRSALKGKLRALQSEAEVKSSLAVVMAALKWKKLTFGYMMDDDIHKVIRSVHEANTFADKMQRKVRFDIKPMPKPTVLSNARNPLESLQRRKRIEFNVEVHNQETRSISMWPYDKFEARLTAMRMLYNQIFEQNLEVELTPENDPFYDPPQDVLFARAHLYLRPILLGVDAIINVPLLDYRGQPQGELAVSITILTPKVHASRRLGSNIDFALRIEGATGLQKRNALDTYVRFTFWDDFDRPYFTQRSFGICQDPVYDFKQKFRVMPVTEKFLRYIEDDALTFEGWCVEQEKNPYGSHLAQLEEADTGSRKSVALSSRASVRMSKKALSRKNRRDESATWEFNVKIEIYELEADGKLYPVTVKFKKDRNHVDRGEKVFRLRQGRHRRLIVTVSQRMGAFNVLENIESVTLQRTEGPYDESDFFESAEAQANAFRPIELRIMNQQMMEDPHEVVCICDLSSETLKQMVMYSILDSGFRQCNMTIRVNMDLEQQDQTSFQELLNIKVYDRDHNTHTMSKSKRMTGSFKKLVGAKKEEFIYVVGSRYRCQLMAKRGNRGRSRVQEARAEQKQDEKEEANALMQVHEHNLASLLEAMAVEKERQDEVARILADEKGGGDSESVRSRASTSSGGSRAPSQTSFANRTEQPAPRGGASEPQYKIEYAGGKLRKSSFMNLSEEQQMELEKVRLEARESGKFGRSSAEKEKAKRGSGKGKAKDSSISAQLPE